MQITEINVFAYSKFNDFVQDFYERKHQADRRFSHRYISQVLGDKSPSFFQKFLEGQRKLSPHQIEQLSRLFGLEEHESRYFRILYLYSHAPSRLERELYLEQLISLNHTPRRELAKDLLGYYGHWYTPVIRSSLSVLNVNHDLKPLVAAIHPKITVQQAREAIQLMAKMKVISKDENDYWKPSDEGLFAKDNFHDAVIQNYRHQCLDLASRVLEEQPSQQDMHFSTATMSLSAEAHQRIMDKLEKFRSDVRSIVRKDTQAPTKVIHLQTQAFPILKGNS